MCRTEQSYPVTSIICNMAGRCFSAVHLALSAARNIAYCCALGEAAGAASAQLIKAGKENVRDIDMEQLKKRLEKNIG